MTEKKIPEGANKSYETTRLFYLHGDFVEL